MDPAILAVFGPVPDGIDVEENKAPENDAAAVAMAVLAAIALVLRLLAKFVQRTGLKIDDWIIIVAFVRLSRTNERPGRVLVKAGTVFGR